MQLEMFVVFPKRETLKPFNLNVQLEKRDANF